MIKETLLMNETSTSKFELFNKFSIMKQLNKMT
jgi:hypothetical protein